MTPSVSNGGRTLKRLNSTSKIAVEFDTSGVSLGGPNKNRLHVSFLIFKVPKQVYELGTLGFAQNVRGAKHSLKHLG